MRVNVTTKRNLMIFSLCIIVGAMGLGFNLLTKKPYKYSNIEEHSGVPMAHAQDESGCATCHTQPLTGSCTSCHPSPSGLNGRLQPPSRPNPRRLAPPDPNCWNAAGATCRKCQTPSAGRAAMMLLSRRLVSPFDLD